MGSLARRRMYNQRLWGERFSTAVEAVGSFGALQAQEYPFARWSLGQRTTGTRDAEVIRAYADGAILRTHLLRPTWHFVLPADIGWMLDVTAPRVHALNAYYYRQSGIDDDLVARTNPLLARAVAEEGHLTRKELAAVLERAGIDARGPRLAYIVMRAELDAIVCSGRPKGSQHTYAPFGQRVPAPRRLDREGALAELTMRYFTARGPATLKDYMGWSSLTAAEARRGVAAAGARLEREVVGERTYWSGARSPGSGRARVVVDLVQTYDECISSYGESLDVLAGPRPARPENARTFVHAVLLDGRLVGHWRHPRSRASSNVEVSLYETPKPAVRNALDRAVERYANFLGDDLTWTTTR